MVKKDFREEIFELTLSPKELDVFELDPVTYVGNGVKKNENVKTVEILKKSIDARKKDVLYRLRLRINGSNENQDIKFLPLKLVSQSSKIVHIIGFGPAGIFAAIRCIQLGLKPIVFERGKAVKERRFDVAALNKTGKLNEESNYCYGEGGAGTFSDGKLYTRSHKRGNIEEVLQLLIAHGASPRIGYEAHPHIGTNKLPQIIEKLRKTIVEFGGEVHFNSKLTDIEIKNQRLISININEKEVVCDSMILATGHSARDVFYLLHRKNIKIEAKPFAMGFRLEHPQDLINDIQYHKSSDIQILPAASYSLVAQVNNKGVFSFCMCPGGIIAPAATSNNEVVVNGWSPSKRNGKFANSGWVTEIDEDAWKEFKEFGPLAGLKFQEYIEQKAFKMGGGEFKVPAQNLTDYLNNKPSIELNANSYHRGTVATNLNELYPEAINYRLREGLRTICKKLKGFDNANAIITAPESRTSSPVRIPRGEDFQHTEVKGLYPCGEGAGYAGGIVSAALDGFKVVNAIHISIFEEN